MRCLALATELQRRGAEVSFYSVEGSTSVAPALQRSGFPVYPLAAADSPIDGAVLSALVVDHYGLSAPHEATFRGKASVIAVIDDLADRPHDCDLLVDMTAGRESQAYATLAPGARCLTGAEYALLRPAFSELRSGSLRRHAEAGSLRRILVSFGLTDPGGITASTAELLLKAAPEASLDVVVRRASPAWRRLEQSHEMTAGDRLRLHDDPAELADLMAEADLAIGAGGVTSWERCCLGLPTIVVRLAENQTENIRALVSAGAAVELTSPAAIGEELVPAVVRLTTPARRQGMSVAAGQLCDGAGARRVADAILQAVNHVTGDRRLQ